MSGGLAPVDVQNLSGDERGAFEIENAVHDVADLADATDGMKRARAFVRCRIVQRGLHDPGRVGVRTTDLVALVQPGADLYPLLAVAGGRYSAMGGGVPLTNEDQVIAGVGVSGGTTEQDVAIVEAAMRRS
jgi:uncharacterized protein GlcG (DUF336 family)